MCLQWNTWTILPVRDRPIVHGTSNDSSEQPVLLRRNTVSGTGEKPRTVFFSSNRSEMSLVRTDPDILTGKNSATIALSSMDRAEHSSLVHHRQTRLRWILTIWSFVSWIRV